MNDILLVFFFSFSDKYVISFEMNRLIHNYDIGFVSLPHSQ